MRKHNGQAAQLKQKKRCVLAAAFATASTLASPNAMPGFARYQVTQHYAGPMAKPVLTTRQDKAFQRQLRRAAHGQPNFAGHYRVVTFGCGASCVMGAMIDAKTGRIVWLPFTVRCGSDANKPPVDFRSDSALLVINGMRNEAGDGTHYYVLKDNRLKFIGSRPQ
ncbi:hypothetical protein H3H36_24840 [Duganella sp. FT3S]|uniref:Uncharacterized protein n=1 Tax=Rugamonas fusca TaxID=2758568 RepID=A0A7W2EMN8_9BURK|nr:hypothetical protein [Rugamonas fusca]MBA5608575.1 hypothetical protein [Rugamonas fusca]